MCVHVFVHVHACVCVCVLSLKKGLREENRIWEQLVRRFPRTVAKKIIVCVCVCICTQHVCSENPLGIMAMVLAWLNVSKGVNSFTGGVYPCH